MVSLLTGGLAACINLGVQCAVSVTCSGDLNSRPCGLGSHTVNVGEELAAAACSRAGGVCIPACLGAGCGLGANRGQGVILLLNHGGGDLAALVTGDGGQTRSAAGGIIGRGGGIGVCTAVAAIGVLANTVLVVVMFGLGRAHLYTVCTLDRNGTVGDSEAVRCVGRVLNGTVIVGAGDLNSTVSGIVENVGLGSSVSGTVSAREKRSSMQWKIIAFTRLRAEI